MNILHYSLGLPPYRSGGLTKYSFDLIEEQIAQGYNVKLIFPGASTRSGDTDIKKYKNRQGINAFEIINPLPVPLLSGIYEPGDFYKACNIDIFKKFLADNNITVVHIHTFMGLHKEFLDACKGMKIRVVYTTHDYFGLCTKVNFLDNNGGMCSDIDINKCIYCNYGGNSSRKISLLQSKEYRALKNIGIISIIKKFKFNYRYKSREVCEDYKVDKGTYANLIDYYRNMFKLIDYFIFNSNVSKEVYERHINCEGRVVSITHSNIKDNRRIKDYSRKILNLTYLGPNKEYKGYNLLCDTMNKIEKYGYKNIVLKIYGATKNKNIKNKNIKNGGFYSYSDLESIFDKTDLLIVPSKCKETFGFVTLEALSYGVPVLMTNNVGSKDIIIGDLKKGIIIDSTENSLLDAILDVEINREKLDLLNKNICSETFKYMISEHTYEIIKIYNN